MTSEKSTIGRSFSVDALPDAAPRTVPGPSAKIRALRLGLAGLAAVSPSLAARAVTRVWFTPPRRPITAEERARLDAGAALDLRVDGRRVAAWSFGDGPTALLVHGWGGHAGQLLDFVAPLVDAGMRAVVLDGLGHGQSDPSPLGRRQGSFVDVARCMLAAAEQVGTPRAILAHSGGAISTNIALGRGLRTDRLVLLAPMARPLQYAAIFEGALGLSHDVVQRWRAHAERRVGFAWRDLDLTTAAARIELPPALVIHDRKDKEVPFTEGQAVAAAWPTADFVATVGLGHQRLLRDPDIIRHAVAFATKA